MVFNADENRAILKMTKTLNIRGVNLTGLRPPPAPCTKNNNF
jgi:hypothetical protein